MRLSKTQLTVINDLAGNGLIYQEKQGGWQMKTVVCPANFYGHGWITRTISRPIKTATIKALESKGLIYIKKGFAFLTEKGMLFLVSIGSPAIKVKVIDRL